MNAKPINTGTRRRRPLRDRRKEEKTETMKVAGD
jgi:hypothetical protein|tara:strand:+ start:58 stop:159 length:102 start_codon:yes stop_codon:yes gene_type:complete